MFLSTLSEGGMKTDKFRQGTRIYKYICMTPTCSSSMSCSKRKQFVLLRCCATYSRGSVRIGKVSAQPHTIVKQICFPNGNVLFLSLFPLFKNWMHNTLGFCERRHFCFRRSISSQIIHLKLDGHVQRGISFHCSRLYRPTTSFRIR